MIARMRKVVTALPHHISLDSLVKLLVAAIGVGLMLSLEGCREYSLGMLNPKGIIAFKERKLMFDTVALMLIVVLPVIVMSLTFVYHYQQSHKIEDYKPDWSHSYFLESIWWGVPCAIIVILAVITWKSTHELDPYQPIAGANEPPLLIEAIALPWKWLFIYPEQNIATINYLKIPVGRQVEFWLTTDNVPMSAIFIPQLGSQIYAMAGMRTRLHLIASAAGDYTGMDTQYNGAGFTDMQFRVYAVSPDDMQTWYQAVKATSPHLTKEVYQTILQPSMENKPAFYAGVEPNLFMHAIHVYEHTFGPAHPRGSQLPSVKE